LEATANHAAGDARVAIGILRNATQLAVRNNLDEITTDVIRKAVPEARTEIQQQTTDKLTTHQEILYEIITNHKEIGGGELYEKYCQQVAEPKTRRTMRNYVTKLEQYDLVIAKGNTKARLYRPVS
jgi:Cdc6-like AAA superfamily ATPase